MHHRARYDPLLEWTHEATEIGLAGLSRPSSIIEIRDRTRSNTIDLSSMAQSRAGSMTMEHNDKAKDVIRRVHDKLNGQDFPNPRAPPGSTVESLDVTLQVAKLIEEATAVENLAQAFMGWCPYW